MIKRTRTTITRLQAKERGHDHDVQGYVWSLKDGQQYPVYIGNTKGAQEVTTKKCTKVTP